MGVQTEHFYKATGPRKRIRIAAVVQILQTTKAPVQQIIIDDQKNPAIDIHRFSFQDFELSFEKFSGPDFSPVMIWLQDFEDQATVLGWSKIND